MAIYIEHLNIDCFRGIQNLIIENLNHINIIAGDNNSGKTSVLEAILFLQNPTDFNNVLRISRIRDLGSTSNAVSVYENFINLFPRNNSPSEISMSCLCKGEQIMFRLFGEQKTIMLAPEDLYQGLPQPIRRERIKNHSDGLEINAFKGELRYALGGKKSSNEVEFHSHNKTTGREIGKYNYMNMVYLSPIDHLRGDIFNNVLRDNTYKEICINILQLFDPQVLDLLYLKSEDTSRPIEYIKHAKLGIMPVSTYGDGIKKVLALANGVAKATNGVLMIDELETAIHSKYYDDIFRFIIKACKQFQVQAFITSHSMGAIDGLLATQDYDKYDTDDISVITCKRDFNSMHTYSRNLSGRRVYSNREEFGFEVRL
jgi:ABC-type transport system involved in cytochrome c biogenesis ATPase subunit